MFGKGATHKLKPKSLQSLTLTLDSEPLVSVQTVYLNLHFHLSPLLTYSLSCPQRKPQLPKRELQLEAESPCALLNYHHPILSPGLSDSGDDPNYKVLLLDVCFLFNIILKMFLCIFNEFLAMHEVCVQMSN